MVQKNIMKNIFIIITTLTTIFFFTTSCEDDISSEVDLGTAPELVVIDAWINNKPEPQTITISTSQAYFDNSGLAGLSGAEVIVLDESGRQYVFEEIESGVYTWTPNAGETFGEIGQDYALAVTHNGVTYGSATTMNRVPPIDSISFTPEEGDSFFEDGFIAEFWSRDPIGEGDTYWIKTWKNGEFLANPDEINVAFDAGFSQGGVVDGLIFIPPIRFAINRFEDEDDDGVIDSPYSPGDSVFVELHSISNEAFFFLNEVRLQTDRPGGFAELFATPLSNVPSNILASNEETEVLGFFTVSGVSAMGRRFEE